MTRYFYLYTYSFVGRSRSKNVKYLVFILFLNYAYLKPIMRFWYGCTFL